MSTARFPKKVNPHHRPTFARSLAKRQRQRKHGRGGKSLGDMVREFFAPTVGGYEMLHEHYVENNPQPEIEAIVGVFSEACDSDGEINREINALANDIENAQYVLSAAERVARRNHRRDMADQLAEALEGVESIHSKLAAGLRVCVELERIKRLREAARKLNQFRDRLRLGATTDDCLDAAEAFGQLFVTLGEFAEDYLPPPANQYAEFLKGCGEFFTNVSYGLNPTLRYRNRPEAEYLP